MNNKVKQVLNTIVEKFKTGEIPDAVALASFPMADIPSGKWSFMNRIIMLLSGTADARGWRQWKCVNRCVKKGGKAIYILVPCFKKEVDKETGEEKEMLRLFKSSPVFRVEDTDGEPLDYLQIKVPELPLLERAKEWGISVKAIPRNYRFHGCYSPQLHTIALATPEEKTFFHELAHAGHEKLNGRIKSGQDPFQEIVAELSAQALCRLVGKQAKDSTGNSFKYIDRYAAELKMSIHKACLRVLSETEKVLNLILKGGENDNRREMPQPLAAVGN